MEALLKETAHSVLRRETETLHSLQELVEDEGFQQAVEILLGCDGRVVMTGLGKSGLIARKISATLSSTGTPSFFMHPSEALHGDLGMTTSADVFVALSNSGTTEELIQMLPSLKLFGNRFIAITGRGDSVLATEADAAITYHIDHEGCPLNLAPMASTTAALALGDTLAAVLMKARRFETQDFARFHPSGALGRKLLIRVRDLMSRDLPLIGAAHSMLEGLQVLIDTNLGAVLCQGENGELLGLISDGDIKRLMQKRRDFQDVTIHEVMTRDPVFVQEDMLAEEALRIMQNKERFVTIVPVKDRSDRLVGLLRMHDILNAKIR